MNKFDSNFAPQEQIDHSKEKLSDDIWPPKPFVKPELDVDTNEINIHSNLHVFTQLICGVIVGGVVSVIFSYFLLRVLPHYPNPNFPSPWMFLSPIPIYLIAFVYALRRWKIFSFSFAFVSITVAIVVTIVVLLLEALDLVN